MSNYIISRKRLEDLIESEEELNSLNGAGVDNWDGCSYAYEMRSENPMDMKVELGRFESIEEQTIYTCAGQSDGYICVYYLTDERLRDWWYDLDCEYFGATDSDEDFTCVGFPESKITTIEDILDRCSDNSRGREALKYIDEFHPHLVDKWEQKLV